MYLFGAVSYMSCEFQFAKSWLRSKRARKKYLATRVLLGKVCAYLPGSERLAAAKCAICCWVFSGLDLACISLWRHNFNQVALPHFLNPSMKLWEVFQKLGKVSWICVYAAYKNVSEKFKHIQNCYNMTTLIKTKHVFMLSAIGSNLQKKIFLLNMR